MNKILSLSVAVALLLAVALVPRPTSATGYTPLERYDQYGIGGGGAYDPELGVAWWRDWDASYNYPPGVGGRPPNKMWTVGKFDNRLDGPPSATVIFTPTVDAVFAYEAPIIASLIITGGYTGQVWEIGNEPNWYPYIYPGLYAYQYQLYYDHIKSLDPTARIMPGGIVPMGTMTFCFGHEWVEEWLDAFLAHDPAIDVWGLHPYATTFTPQASISEIEWFRAELDERGYGETPIWLTEFGWGNWSPHDPADIAQYAAGMGHWLNWHHGEQNIERWFWWGVLAGGQGMGSGGLFSAAPYSYETMTVVGSAYFTARNEPVYTYHIPIFITSGEAYP